MSNNKNDSLLVFIYFICCFMCICCACMMSVGTIHIMHMEVRGQFPTQIFRTVAAITFTH